MHARAYKLLLWTTDCTHLHGPCFLFHKAGCFHNVWYANWCRARSPNAQYHIWTLGIGRSRDLNGNSDLWCSPDASLYVEKSLHALARFHLQFSNVHLSFCRRKTCEIALRVTLLSYHSNIPQQHWTPAEFAHPPFVHDFTCQHRGRNFVEAMHKYSKHTFAIATVFLLI